MTESKATERDRFLVCMARAMPGARDFEVAQAAQRLMRAASKHQRACEGACSIPSPDGTEDDDEAGTRGFWGRMADAAIAAAEKACPDGWRIDHQGDPRGGTLWLQAKGSKGDDYHLRLYPPATGFPARVFDRMVR